MELAPLARAALAAGALVLIGGATGCSVEAAAPEPSVPGSIDELPRLFGGDDGAEIPAGTYGADDNVGTSFQVSLGDGWVAFGDWAIIKDDAVFLSFGSPTHVPVDSCAWSGTLTEVGPSVADFADAIAAMSSTLVEDQIDVEIDGHTGVDIDIAVDPGVDLNDCDNAVVCAFAYDDGDCFRYYSSATERERMRVLDLEGARFVITAGEFSPTELRAEALEVLDSIRFEPASAARGASVGRPLAM